MEACLMKPEVKKRPKPPKPPPKPTEMSRTEIDSFLKSAPAERPTPVQRQTPPQRPVPVQRKTPVVPQRPTDSELSHTQYRLKRPEVNGNVSQETKYKPTETPVVPPRPTEQELKSSRQYSQHRREQAHDTQSSKETNHATSTEGPKDKTDFRQTNGLGVTGALWKSQKEKSPLFTSYVTESTEEKSDLTQQAPAGSKPGGLKGVMKSLQFKTSPKVSRDSSPDPGSVEASTEDEKSAEKQKNNAGLKQRSELSTSTDSLSENKEKGGIFSGMFKKSPKTTENEEIEAVTSEENLSENNNNNKAKEKGGVFSGMFKKSPKPQEEPEREEGEEGLLHSELSASSDSLSENKEKGGLFSGLLKKTPKAAAEEKQPLDDEISTSSETSESSAKEKGGIFGGIFKKAHKPVEDAQTDEENSDKELSTSSENLSEKKQEKGGVFSGLLKKTPKTSAEKTESPDEEDQKELRGSNEDLTETNTNKEKKIFSNLFKRQKTVEDTAAEKENSGDELSTSAENLSENKQDKGIFSGLLKKTPKTPKERTASPEREEETKASNDDLTETNKEKNKFTNLFKKPQKPAEGATAEEDQEENGEDLSGSCENLFASAAPKEKKGGFAGIFKRSASIDNLFDSEDNIFTDLFKKPNKNAEGKSADEDSLKPLSSSCENLPEATKTKEKSGGFASMFKKSPKPAPRSVTNEDPLSDSQFEFGSCDSIPDMIVEENLSASNDDLSTKEKKTVFSGMFKRTPKPAEPQEGEDVQPATGIGIKRRKTIKKKQRVVSFRIKKTLPRLPKLAAQDADKMPIIEETVELQDLNTVEENAVEVEPVEMAAYPTEENPVETEEEDDELMDWWKTVAGWAEWIETSNQEENEEEAMEEAADRVYMAARLFVQLFNQRGASLQHRIMELMAFADAADQFHKKTVSAAVGGGVASVAGSVATITGLILAPFTFGASIIVTAVGIGVATAGSITSATANITDTVHSNMDRKKVEKMIQGYQQEMKDIRECLEFVQEGMDTLQEWDFEKFSESAAKKALNHNIKHVVKEGGRAGKALMINTDKLISTVQVLGAAGGVAKAAKAISVTTGVMSALFLALDIFFLAKDSHELRKGAKTKFATKIREVCKDLQDGLLELNKVKTQLQKTMDGIEVEEYEEIQEVEEEVEDDLESDPVKLAELEQELDLMEEKLDKRVEEERKRKEEEEKKRREEEAKAAKEKLQEESEDEEEGDYDLKKGKDDAKKLKSEKEIKGKAVMDEEKTEQGIYSVKESIKEFFKDPILKVTKKDKDMENKITADKEKSEKDKSVLSKKTHKKEASLSGKELLDAKDEEKLEKVKSQKDGDMAKQKETAKDEKSKVKSQKESQTAKQEAKTEEKVMSPRESKTGQDSKVEEKVSVKSLRESWMAKQENADEKVSVKSLKMTKQEDTTNVDEKVKNLRESWMAKQENPDGKVSVKSLKEANKREDMTNVDEKVKNLRESWLAKEKIADEKVSVKSLKQEDTTNVDEKVKNLRESWLTKEDKTKDITKKEEKVTSPRESHKTHQEMTTQEEKVSVKSPRESHSSRKVEGVEIRHKAEWRSEKKKQVRERGEEEVESSRRHSSSRSDSDKSSFRSNRSKHERKTEEEKGVKTRDHHEAALRRERSDREGQNSRVEIDHNRTSHNEKRERSTRNHFERADKAEEEERSKKKSQKGSDSDRESGRGHRESGRSHTESGRSHRDGDRESRRSHREGHLRESDRRREHGGSRPRSNALLEDGLYI